MGSHDGEGQQTEVTYREGRRQEGHKWQRDEKGRKFRHADSGERIYERSEDRDSAVEESYRFSPGVLLVFAEKPTSTLASVAACVNELAEMFYTEQRSERYGTLEERYQTWQIRHFGRALEVAPRGVLFHEVRRRLALSEGGAVERRGAAKPLFVDYREQQRFEHAASGAPDGMEAEAKARWIAEQAGAKLGQGGIFDMPEASGDGAVREG